MDHISCICGGPKSWGGVPEMIATECPNHGPLRIGDLVEVPGFFQRRVRGRIAVVEDTGRGVAYQLEDESPEWWYSRAELVLLRRRAPFRIFSMQTDGWLIAAGPIDQQPAMVAPARSLTAALATVERWQQELGTDTAQVRA